MVNHLCSSASGVSGTDSLQGQHRGNRRESMVTTSYDRLEPFTLGHIAMYARDGRWRRAMAKSLGETGHSNKEAASPTEIHRLLLSQRFDVLVLKVRDQKDAREIAQLLDGIALPPHCIVVGRGGAPLLTLRPENGGTLRFSPGPLGAREVSHLVGVSMDAGTWEQERFAEDGSDARIEAVDIEEAIEGAASAVYAQAKRKRQRFRTVVDGEVAHVLADPARLLRAMITLIRLCVSLAPRGALISVEAQAGREEWAIRIRAAAGYRRTRASTQLAVSLRDEARVLTAVSRDIQRQGGLLWVDLLGPQALAVCLTLPVPTGREESAFASSTGPSAFPPPAVPRCSWRGQTDEKKGAPASVGLTGRKKAMGEDSGDHQESTDSPNENCGQQSQRSFVRTPRGNCHG